MRFQSATHRPDLLSQLSERNFDLLVIGGGATGAGIALDAASRGMAVALVEKKDFAFGTSSRSTKLIHGGLRYLKQLEIKLVHEVGSERATVHRLAPHLVVSEPMLLPLVKGGTYGKWATAFGLWVYDLLAGVSGKDRRVMLGKSHTLEKEPLLREDILLGSGRYAEYRTDDARLTLENIKAAIQHGALVANYVEATGFHYGENQKITGVTAHDTLGGKSLDIRAKLVINAAGPWVDELRQKNQSMNQKRLFLTKGVHIVFPKERFPLRQSIYFDVPDGRMIFAIPRGKVTYVGTTDTEYKADKDRPLTYLDDVTYLIDASNRLFPSIKLRVEDVVSSWAGLRPLIFEEGKSASEISRKDEIFLSDTGLISIAGGKLTGYRKMAEKVVDVAAKHIQAHSNQRFTSCLTKKIPLGGLAFDRGAVSVDAYRDQLREELSAVGLEAYQAWYLVHLYGRQSDQILDYFRQGKDLSERGLILAELAYGLEEEMVHTLTDFFVRRTGRLYFDIESVRTYAEEVAAAMADHFGWSESRISFELQSLHQEMEDVSVFRPNPEAVSVM